MRRRLAIAVCVAVPCLAVAVAWAARKPEDVFGGKIMVSEKPYPTTSSSPNAYIAAVKKQSRDRFQEDREKKQWKIHYAAFFKKPVNDLELQVKLYDVTDGNQRLVEAYEQFLQERGQRVVIGNIKLKKGDGSGSGYDPNSKILMVMESKGKIVASVSFYIQGEGRRYKGQVDFSEDETKGNEELDETSEDEAARAAEEKKRQEEEAKKKKKKRSN